MRRRDSSFSDIDIPRLVQPRSFIRGVAFGGIGDAFLPSDVADLVGWWDFGDSNEVTESGGSISAIGDKSTANNDLSQGTGSLQPRLITNGQNGLDTADFTGDRLSRTASTSYSIGAGDFLIALAFESDGVGGKPAIFTLGGSGNRSIYITDPPDVWDGTSEIEFPSLDFVANTAHVCMLWRSGTSLRLELDGTLDTDSRTTSASFLSNDEIHIGSNFWGENFNGEAFEILLYESLPSASERDQIRDYLANRWGISLFTPADLTELFWWLDVDSDVTLIGSDVSNWEPRNTVPGNEDFTGALGERPAYTGVTINSKQALEFAGVEQLFNPGSSPNIGTGDFYVALVVEFATLAADDTLIGVDGGSTPFNFFIDEVSSTPEFTVFLGSTPEHNFFSLTPSTSTPYVVELWRDGTSVRMRLNGTLDTDSETSSKSAGTGSQNWTIANAGFGNLDGKLGDIVFCNALPSSADRDKVKDYLANKFGITVS